MSGLSVKFGVRCLLLLCLVGTAWRTPCLAAQPPQVLDDRLHHLRIEGVREWAEFPEVAEAAELQLRFTGSANERPGTLQLRQQDVKQVWTVQLNGQNLGQLIRDENDMVIYLDVPPGTIQDGDNRLIIRQTDSGRQTADDIRVGELKLWQQPAAEVLSQASLQIRVLDADAKQLTPARITIQDQSGALQTVSVIASPQLAVRPGTVYTATGEATIGLPAGTWQISAGRGFEYSLATATVTCQAGEPVQQTLNIRRQVSTEGYVACDTHVHTLTHSGHGDATVQERMVTIAAEGIELAVATDHNVQIDHDPFAREVGVRKYFTPVIGNEVTTPVGHFNIFPVAADAAVPKHQFTDWQPIFEEIDKVTAAPVIVLNHARDLHSNVRPFGPKRFNSAVAESLDGWPVGFNAMEVVNSGATQTDVMQLFHDWMALLNRGAAVTPVGSSDSHDVSRHFVGQGRTYIRCDDSDPGNIDVAQAVASLQQGRVMVSYGLLAQIDVEGHGSGELVSVSSDTVRVNVRVLGPDWVDMDQVQLFANGIPIKAEPTVHAMPGRNDQQLRQSGILFSGHWTLPRPQHDVFLVAIAAGPGVDQPYWKTAKPYQPTSPEWQARVIGCSGAVWLDGDADSVKSAARDYARRVWDIADGELPRLLARLSTYDAAVAAHAADLYHAAGGSVNSDEYTAALRTATPDVQAGFRTWFNAWRDTQTARLNPAE